MQVYRGINKINESEMKLNIKLSYTLAKNLKQLQPIAEAIENEQKKIFLKYGNEQANGEITVPKERAEELLNDLKELLAIDNKVEITKITLSDFDTDVIDFSIINDLIPIIIDK